MSGWMRLVAYAMITLFLGVLLREFGFRGARLFSILGSVTVVSAVALAAMEDGLLSSYFQGGDSAQRIGVIMKVLGVGYVSGICADVCSDLGESGLANAVTLVGRVEIIMLSLPSVKEIIEQGMALL